MYGAKNIINGGRPVASGSGSSSVPPPITELGIYPKFYADTGLDTWRHIQLHLYKTGTMVTVCVRQVSVLMENVNRWIATAVIPEGWRPAYTTAGIFSPLIGSDLYDSDIFGGIIISPTGTIEINREMRAGTAVWDGDEQGWQGITLSYPTAWD